MNQSLRILIVEDSENDIALLLRTLNCCGYSASYEIVDTPATMRSALESQNWDVITSDHNMPQFNAPAALALAKELRPEVPFIIVSGEINLNLAVALMRKGAQDYIQKHELARLIPALERELREVQLRREQQRGDAALKVINERLHEVMENSLDASYKRNLLTNKYEYVSPVVLRISGFTPDEIISMPPEAILSSVHPEDRDELNRILAEAISSDTNSAYQVEYRFKHKNGDYRWLQDHFTVMRDPCRQPLSLIGSVSDITERKRSEEALRASEANLAEAQQIAHIGSWEWDMVLNSVKWSDEMYRVFDIDPDTYDGKPESVLKVIHPEDVEVFTESMNTNLENGKSPSLEYRVIHKDGSIHNISANGRVEFSKEGNPMRSVGTVQDITERKKITEALRESEERYKFLHEKAGVGIGYFSPGGKVISYNLVAANHMAGKPEDFTGKSVYDLFPPREAELYMARINKAAASSEIQEYEDKVELPRESKWFVSTYNRILDSSNQVVGIQITSTDITTRKQAEEALRESEAKHKSMIANISDIIAIMSRDGTIQYKSPNIKKWFGWDPEDLIGTNGWDTVHPDDLERIQNEFSLLLETEKAQKTVEYRYRCKDGSYRLINLTAVNLINDPTINGLLMNYHDVTEQKRLEEAQRLSEEKFSTAFRISPDSININRLNDGLYLDINEGFTNLTGYTSEDVSGKTSLELNIWVHSHDRERLVKGLREQSEVLNLEAPFRCKNGDIKICQMSARIIELNQEKCILSITRDITERKQAEEQIHQLNADLERRVAERTVQLTAANRELESFSYSVSHDLRTPLRSLDGYSTLLLENYAEQLDEAGKHYIARIQSNSRRMGQLINDLLNLSRVAALATFDSQQVDLSALANAIAADIKAQSPQHAVEFDIAANMIAQGDENLLKIVLENLLHNAYKFSNQRDPATIQVGMTQQNGKDTYFVRDNGAGFNMDYANKLFIPFQRLHSEREFPGTGIGLATVQRIIHRHGGRVWAEGKVGAGATFYFTIG